MQVCFRGTANSGCVFLSRDTIHRAPLRCSRSKLRNAKPQGASEPRLILIERAEGTGSKSEGRSNMQDVQGASAKEPGLGSGNPPGMCEGSGGNRQNADQPRVDIH